MNELRIPRPDDWHLHLRDEQSLRAVLPFTAARFARAIVMPNLKPPVTTTDMAIAYRQRIVSALPAGSAFVPLMTRRCDPRRPTRRTMSPPRRSLTGPATARQSRPEAGRSAPRRRGHSRAGPGSSRGG